MPLVLLGTQREVLKILKQALVRGNPDKANPIDVELARSLECGSLILKLPASNAHAFDGRSELELDYHIFQGRKDEERALRRDMSAWLTKRLLNSK